jgi:hypothetical protein
MGGAVFGSPFSFFSNSAIRHNALQSDGETFNLALNYSSLDAKLSRSLRCYIFLHCGILLKKPVLR